MSSNLRLVVDTIDTCSKETVIDIAKYPFATNVGTPGQVLQVYQSQVQEIETYLGKDQILVDQLLPVVHTLYSLSGLLCEAVSLVCDQQSTTAASFRACVLRCKEPYLATRAILVVVDVLITVRVLFTSYDSITVTADHHLGYQWAYFWM